MAERVFIRKNDKPWRQGWELTDDERDVFRQRSRQSNAAKVAAVRGHGPEPVHDINVPSLDPDDLMAQLPTNGVRSLSLFSGCGGLDHGYERAGYEHVASYDHYAPAGETMRAIRPSWEVYSGEAGDVTKVNWRPYRGRVDVVHGGPPCQPFSMAGRQLGKNDTRDMFPEFVRAVLEIKPQAFMAENVAALGSDKFSAYVKNTIIKPLSAEYQVVRFQLTAASFGVPQRRQRLFFVGFRSKRAAMRFKAPAVTHSFAHLEPRRAAMLSFHDLEAPLERCMGAREALGLPDIGFDALAPTLRSSLTGPRHTTSVVSSVTAHKLWTQLGIWPNGVAPTREAARQFVAANGDFRLSVPDCAILQGFPESWPVLGSVYVALGQIGNAVPPPLAYHIAKQIAATL
ncbi:MAG: DNA-methyltransferase Dcm [Gemmatimonadetes bacterium]|nr:DNA-methyltransferase Dcm [Gemmatimonadota bacterium]